MDKFIYEQTNKELEQSESIRRFFFNINGCSNNYILRLNDDGSPSQDCFLIDGTRVLPSSLMTVGVKKEGVEQGTLLDDDEVKGNQSHLRDVEGGELSHLQHKP